MTLTIVSRMFLLALCFLSQNGIAQTAKKEKHRKKHFGIGIAKPLSIGADNNHYEKLFGSGSNYPEFWTDYNLLPIGWGFDFGVSFRAGLYRDSGKGAKSLASGELGDSDVDTSQKSILTLIPIQAAANISFSPFANRFMVFNVWSGLSFTYVENTLQANLDDEIDQADVKPYVNSGFNQESITGASISFDMSSLDVRSAYSMKVYGISGVFLTPYVQIVTTIDNKVGVYDRTLLGVMLSFETMGS